MEIPEKSLTERVLEITAKTLKTTPQNIPLDAYIENLVDDSIQLFELILAFETEFGTKADYKDLMAIETMHDIITYLKSRGL